MWIKEIKESFDDLEESFKSLLVPDNSELNKSLDNLKLDSFFNDAVLILRQKLQKSNKADERELYEHQIEDLYILNEKFKIYVERRMTNKTNKELSSLFKSVVWEIEQAKSLDDEIIKIDDLINNEKTELNDNYDIFWYNMNFRDFVESKIDFVWTLEIFREPEDINKFYHFFTIEYINFVNDNEALKMLHNKLEDRSWLMLTEQELDKLLVSTIWNLLKKWIIINNREIKLDILIWTWSNQKKIQRDLSEIKDCILEPGNDWKDCSASSLKISSWKSIIDKSWQSINKFKKEVSKNQQEINDLDFIFKQSRRLKNDNDNLFTRNDYKGKNKKKINEYESENYRNYLNNTIYTRNDAIKKAKELIKKWIITKEYLFENNYILYLELYPLSNDITSVWMTLIKYYLNNINVIRNKKDWWNIEINPMLISKKRNEITSNLRTLCLLFTEIESNNWDPKSWNLSWSSAKWLYQFLTSDWRNTTEYLDPTNNEWKNKSWNKKWKPIWVSREVWNTSSYETALNKIPNFISVLSKSWQDNSWVIKILEKLFMKATWYNNVRRINNRLPNNFSPTNLSSDEQTILFLVNSFENWKVINDKVIQDYMWLVILWNIWWTEKIYEIFHHTAPDENTIELIKRCVALHHKKFVNIK